MKDNLKKGKTRGKGGGNDESPSTFFTFLQGEGKRGERGRGGEGKSENWRGWKFILFWGFLLRRGGGNYERRLPR